MANKTRRTSEKIRARGKSRVVSSGKKIKVGSDRRVVHRSAATGKFIASDVFTVQEDTHGFDSTRLFEKLGLVKKKSAVNES
jgi:hypothetical protein